MSCVNILKSDEDKRLYRRITLENKLEALIIHDQHTDKASAALDVNVGYFCDPEDTPGLAHFCEHMLFLGTEKYPDEKTYISYLNIHGGSSNAYTTDENTNYFFDVSHTQLEGALDRFAQFFISPLFTQSATDREMNAVHSEHCKNLQDDNWRNSQLTKSMSNPKHPYYKFGTGSLETLQTHSDLRDKLLKFHSTYYSSNIMKLVVLGCETLDQIETWVREKFSEIKNKHVTVPKFDGEPFPPDFLRFRLSTVPVKDLRMLRLLWPIPPQRDLWRSKPSHVLGHLIGHEGEGSILSILKKKGWVNQLSAGTMEEGSTFSIFGIIMNLAEEGINHEEDIINIIFQYIKLLKKEGIQKWVYEELKTLSAIEFQFKDQSPPMSYVSTLSSAMHLYPGGDILSGMYLLYSWEPELVNQVLEALNPSKFFVSICSKLFEGKTDKEEKWYGTPHKVEQLEETLLKKLSDPELTAGLHLPHTNPFLPDDFSRRSPTPSHLSLVPIPTYTNQYTLWYKYDSIFNVPKAFQIIQLITPEAYSSPRATVMTKIFGKLVSDALNEYAYDAQVAGLEYHISNNNEGLQLLVRGYNCKQSLLIEKIAEKIANLEIDPERFEIIREETTRDYANFFLEQPCHHAVYQASLCLDKYRWSSIEYLAVSPTVTLEELRAFVPRLLANLYIEALVNGNLTREDAQKTIDILLGVLKAKPLNRSQFPVKQIIRLESGKTYLHQILSFNPDEVNSAILVVLEVGPDEVHSNALIDLFSQCSSTSAFSQLRTVEQLGYLVWSEGYRQNGIHGFRVIVQSDTKDPVYLEERIENWIGEFEKELIDLPVEEFIKFRTGLIVQRLEKDKSLKEEAERWSSEIEFPRAHMFDRAALEAAAVEKLTKKDIVDFYKNYISKSGQFRKKLSVHVFGKDHKLPTPTNETITYITDIVEFKKESPVYPVLYTLAQHVKE